MTTQSASLYSVLTWKPDPAIAQSNFGDELSPLICEKILNTQVSRVTNAYASKKVLAGGSVLHFAKNGDVVWGSGVRDTTHAYDFTDVDIRAVRGPMTRDFIQKRGIMCPEVYGDPALLLPTLLPELTPSPIAGRVGVVPHYLDVRNMPMLPRSFRIIFPGWPVDYVVREILSCEFIISSSLHGIIVAEAFGIPACWVRFPSSQPEYKFADYFLSTGREPRFATGIQQAVEVGGMNPIRGFDPAPLLEAFPRDIFSYA